MNIVITGGTGLVGTYLSQYLDGIYLSSKDFDLTKESEVIKMFETHQPEIVIHLAAKVGGILENIKVRAIPSVRKYRVIEGNHRIKILKELYGDDYIQSCIVDNMSESPSSPEGTSGLSYNAEAISNDGRPLHK